MTENYAKIQARRIIRANGNLDVLNVVKFDAGRFSLRVFGFEDVGGKFADSAEVKRAINEFVPPGIIYRPKFKNQNIRGEDLHESLSGEVLYGIGEYCLDYSEDQWGMHSNRDTKNLWVLSYDLDRRCVQPVFVYTATNRGKWGRDAVGNLTRSIIICQVRLPFSDSKITDAHIRINTKRALVLGDTSTFDLLLDPTDYYAGIHDRTACDGFPHLTLNGPDTIPADGAAALQVQLTNNQGARVRHPNVIVHAKTDAGYLPKTQLPLSATTGQATIPITALGLTPGDQLTVKAGFKHYSNAADHTLTVT